MHTSAFTLEALEQRQLLTVPINAFGQTNLISDGPPLTAAHTDANLVNPWGVVVNPNNGNIWVNDNAKSVATVYSPNGTATGLVVSIPAATGSTASAPTGIVFNGNANNFKITNSSVATAATFIFASEDGGISAWNSASGTAAHLVVDNGAAGAVYKGLAMDSVGANTFLYAANFHAGTIDVFDNTFAPASAFAGKFVDPLAPAGYAPFNIDNIGGKLYVAYAKQDSAKHDDVPGAGLGFVDIYKSDGTFVKRFATGGKLNAPWAIMQAPAGFGPFGGRILVGNFGNGHINVFNASGKFLDALRTKTNKVITISGLWGLRIARTATGATTSNLLFASGPSEEAHGLFGRLTPLKHR